ncbi:MAG: CBS domain-containing protein [Candidatus Lokiarchaeota archaeon]|nr:CBS domain-containing protein [Candidatus Lokiarchaeota archaeon]
MPKIIDFARTNLIKADIDTSFGNLAELMLKNNIGSIVITVEGEIVGFVDDKSILKLISEKKNPNDLKVEQFVQKFPLIHEETHILDAWEDAKELPHERYGIINEDGKIIGIIRKRTMNRFRYLILKEEMNIEDDFLM